MLSKPRYAVAALMLLCPTLRLESREEARSLEALRAEGQAALSTLEGKLSVRGLRAPVEVIRDRWGIPHIYAQSEDDLFFAQGYVQAQDRLFQMELWRRQTQGRLAEFLGAGWVERDRMTRLVTRYRGDLDAEWRSYGPTVRRAAERFVAGVNAQVEAVSTRPPLEFSLAGFRPEPWKAEDLLARAEAFGMSSNAQSEVSRARLVQRYGQKTAQLLRPPDPPVDWGVPEGLVLEAVGEGLAAALAAIGVAPKFGDWSKPGSAGYDDEGSNNWVVAGSRTPTGKPVLANDPHRALDHPSLRYLVHLEAPGFRAIGAVVPWFPGIAIGHNERIGWGLTIFNIDAQDLVQETLDPADRERYRVGDGWERMRVVQEVIRGQGRRRAHGGVEVHTPRPRGLRGPEAAPGLRASLDRAASRAPPAIWPAFAGPGPELARVPRGASRWKMPGENFVYADVEGNIGYQATGLAPIRRKGTGLLPVPGQGGEYDWQGFASLDELPHALNPPEGFLATANHNTLRPGDRVVSHEWSNQFRIGRILEVLRKAERFGVAESQALQQDLVALPARSLVPLAARRLLPGRRRGCAPRPSAPAAAELEPRDGPGQRGGGDLRRVPHSSRRRLRGPGPAPGSGEGSGPGALVLGPGPGGRSGPAVCRSGSPGGRSLPRGRARAARATGCEPRELEVGRPAPGALRPPPRRGGPRTRALRPRPAVTPRVRLHRQHDGRRRLRAERRRHLPRDPGSRRLGPLRGHERSRPVGPTRQPPLRRPPALLAGGPLLPPGLQPPEGGRSGGAAPHACSSTLATSRLHHRPCADADDERAEPGEGRHGRTR